MQKQTEKINKRKMEISTEEARILFLELFNSNQIGMVLYDADNLDLLKFNNRIHTDLGYSPSEFSKLKPFDFIVNEDNSHPEEITEYLLKEKKIVRSFKLIHKNGKFLHFIINASVIYSGRKKLILGIFQNIEDMAEKEALLHLHEEENSNLQNNLPVSIFSTSVEGNFIYANNAMVEMLGYDSFNEMKLINAKKLYGNPQQREKLIRILQKKRTIQRHELRMLRKDHTSFWALISVRSIVDNEGRIFRFDGIIEDISELKSIRKNLEKANKKISSINQSLESKISEALRKQEDQHTLLIQKSKLESLGELAAGIAHEINQPLGVMALTFENLQMKINSGSAKPDYLKAKFQSVEKNIMRIRDIIDHIRIFSREQEIFNLEKVHVNKVVQRALSLIGAQYRNHDITIRLELQQNLGFSVGSNIKLEQIVLNLLSNSKYALEEKSIIEAETEFKKEILIKTEATAKNIYLTIKDNGTGIRAELLPKIFDPFFTTKPEGYGTGLGLSIVYGIIQNMHGDITVESEDKKYTKFLISLLRFPEKD